MRNNRIRLTESQLHNVIKESVKKVLREEYDSSEYEGLIDKVLYACSDAVNAIKKLQEYYANNVNDSYARKNGDKSIALIRQAYKTLCFMLCLEE